VIRCPRRRHRQICCRRRDPCPCRRRSAFLAGKPVTFPFYSLPLSPFSPPSPLLSPSPCSFRQHVSRSSSSIIFLHPLPVEAHLCLSSPLVTSAFWHWALSIAGNHPVPLFLLCFKAD
jgi:hypothetical protein